MIIDKMPFATHQAIYNLVKREWHIQANLIQVRRVSLEEPGISTPEVNWLLNQIEWEYQFEIEEGSVSFRISLQEFIDMILRASRKRSVNP